MKKSILLAGVAYLAGIAIASRFGRESRTSDVTPQPSDTGTPQSDSFGHSFVADVTRMHTRAWDAFSDAFLTEEMRRQIFEYRTTLLDAIKEFRDEAYEHIERVRHEGGEFGEKFEREIRDLYAQYADRLREVNDRGTHIVGNARDRGARVWSEALMFFDETYADIRREFSKKKPRTKDSTKV